MEFDYADLKVSSKLGTVTALYLQPNGNTKELLKSDEVQRLFPFEVEMPCGYVFKMETVIELPVIDLPCPCGDEKHWLVRWGESEIIPCSHWGNGETCKICNPPKG